MPLIIYIILGAIAAVFLLTVVASWIFARLFCMPGHKKSNITPADYGLQFESVTFPSNGKQLKGWFMSGDAHSNPLLVVILTHGWSSNAAQLLQLAQLLHEAGLTVLSYNTRGHGDSPGDGPITLLKFVQDLRAAVDYVSSRQDLDTTRLVVVGHSMGGAATIVAASLDARIKVAVSSSAFADPEELTKVRMRRFLLPQWPCFFLVRRIFQRWLGTTMSEFAPKKRISYIKIPLLLIHGASDTSVQPENVHILYTNSSKGITECLLVPGRGHPDIIEDAVYLGRVIEFISRNLMLSEKENSPLVLPF